MYHSEIGAGRRAPLTATAISRYSSFLLLRDWVRMDGVRPFFQVFALGVTFIFLAICCGTGIVDARNWDYGTASAYFHGEPVCTIDKSLVGSQITANGIQKKPRFPQPSPQLL